MLYKDSIKEYYDYHLQDGSNNMNEHLPTLKRFSSECNSVVEMGIAWAISTWGLLAGEPKMLTSIDLRPPEFHTTEKYCSVDRIKKMAKDGGVEFNFIASDTLEIDI